MYRLPSEAIRMGGADIPITPIQLKTAFKNANKLRGDFPLGLRLPKSYNRHSLEPNIYDADAVDLEAFLIEACYNAGFIGADPYFFDLLKDIRLAAHSSGPVMITGEMGTGKEQVAKCIHSILHGTTTAPFVAVNCAGIPAELLESELFGYKKGAFTGAHKDTPGRFEEAHGGTIFLDEIGDMPLETQAKILRVLNDKKIRPLGAPTEREIKVRIISATNIDLEGALGRRAFRSDLFYRLNGMQIDLPPLYARPGDLLLLTYFFIKSFNLRADEQHAIHSVSAWALLQAAMHRWRGNIRELKSQVEISCERARWHKDKKGCLIRFDLQPDLPDSSLAPDVNKEIWHEDLDMKPPIPVNDLPVFDLSGLLRRLDAFYSPAKQRRWAFPRRLSMLVQEETDLDPSIGGSHQQDTQIRHNHSQHTTIANPQPDPGENLENSLAYLKFVDVKYHYSKMLHDKNSGDPKKAADMAGITDKRTIENWWHTHNIPPM